MTKLEERKAAIEKEMKEIEILEKQAAIRDAAAATRKDVDRLLLDLIDQPLACSLPIKTVSHVKRAFDKTDDDCKVCFFADNCSSIISLTGKGKGSRKNSGSKRTFNNNKLVKDFSRASENIFTFTVLDITYKINYSDFTSFKAGLKEIIPFKDCEKAGLSKGQWQGLTHRKSMKKLFN